MFFTVKRKKKGPPALHCIVIFLGLITTKQLGILFLNWGRCFEHLQSCKIFCIAPCACDKDLLYFQQRRRWVAENKARANFFLLNNCWSQCAFDCLLVPLKSSFEQGDSLSLPWHLGKRRFQSVTSQELYSYQVVTLGFEHMIAHPTRADEG